MSVLGPFALAFVAGAVSFTSPCCLPLMPGYVSYVAGISSDEGAGSVTVAARARTTMAARARTTMAARARTTMAACLFVVGFTTVFTLLGAGASLFGGWILGNREALIRFAGIFVIGMGLVTIGIVRIPIFHREARLDLRRIRPGPAGAIPLGAAFAIGCTPCIGPVLAGILTAAASVQGALRGATLLFVYSLGLGLPFVLLAYGYAGTARVFTWLRRYGREIELLGGGPSSSWVR